MVSFCRLLQREMDEIVLEIGGGIGVGMMERKEILIFKSQKIRGFSKNLPLPRTFLKPDIKSLTNF